MTSAPRPLRPQLTALLLVLSAVACKAKTDDFYAKVFPCSGTSSLECGTTKAGKPMTCVSSASLGGGSFCAETCDPNETAPLGSTCTASGALLQQCTPNVDAGADASVVECPAGLSCYRTSLAENRGLCLSVPTCTDNSECGTGTICASAVVKAQLPPALASAVTADHLHCLRGGCKSSGMSCPTGQVCIGSVLAFDPDIDNLCVPACDSNKDCPPNFTCLRNPETAPGGPHMCFPGMVGARCSTDQNCLIGACTDVGVEFDVCSLPCATDAQCAALSTDTDVFVCAKNHCVTARPFQGANCSPTGDDGAVCPAGLRCFDESPYGGVLLHGECRVACDPLDHSCPARGGLPHVCLGAAHDGGCYPSSFGTPCATKADCVANFECMLAGPDPHSNTDYSDRICTVPCEADADCDKNVWTKKIGFCSSEHICRLAAGIGGDCDRATQCISRRCVANHCVAPI
jgi:hypothetical protein